MINVEAAILTILIGYVIIMYLSRDEDGGSPT